MRRPLAAVIIAPLVLSATTASLHAQAYPLESLRGLRLHNVSAEPAVLHGERGVRLTVSEEGRRLVRETKPGESNPPFLAVIEGSEFANGVIEAEIAGAPEPGAGEGARGFVGIALRVQPGLKTYDAFYLRPTNGRADDQVRRNHSVQYISHPDWTWSRLRQESPKKYESYVDLVPGAWTRIRIEVRGDRARLFVHGQEQPTLLVNDVKTGAEGRGAIALWIDVGTVAHFRNLRVSSAGADRGASAREREVVGATRRLVASQRSAASLPDLLERCWRDDGIETRRDGNSNFDQRIGHFLAAVRASWCRTSLEARGPVARRGNRDYLTRIDSLTLSLSTDTITAVLRERLGEPPRLVVNGKAASADWWRSGTRERLLALARVPLP